MLDGTDADPARIARHWELGGDLARAHDRYIEAARDRSAHFAYRDARRLYDAALALLGPDEGLLTRVEATGQSTYRWGGLAQARTELRDTLDRALRAGDARAEVEARGWLVQVLVDMGHADEAEPMIAEALDGYRGLDPGRYAMMLETVAAVHTRRGRSREAIACHQEALAIFEALGWSQQRATAASHLAGDLRQLGDLQGSLALEEQALEELRRLGDRFYEGIVLSNLGSLHLELGDLDAAEDLLDQATRVHREVDNRRSLGLVLLNRGELALARNRPDEARSLLDQALPLHRECGSVELEASALCLVARAEHASGHPEAVWEPLLQAIRMQRDGGLWTDLAVSLQAAATLARTAAGAPEPAVALQLVDGIDAVQEGIAALQAAVRASG